MDVQNMKTWTPMLFEKKIWTIERRVERSNVEQFFCSTWIENNDVSTLFVTSTSTPRDAVTVLPVEFSKWIFEICKICKIYLILTTYSISFDVATTTKSWRARNINTASASKCKIYRCTGSSSWLSALPLKEQGFDLNKSEFQDALNLRYDKPLKNMPSKCACGKTFSVTHAMNCALGGFVRRNKKINRFTSLLWQNVTWSPGFYFLFLIFQIYSRCIPLICLSLYIVFGE